VLYVSAAVSNYFCRRGTLHLSNSYLCESRFLRPFAFVATRKRFTRQSLLT